jgi:pimeloyl-ACP methyl ester carboxylesterase
MAYSGEGSPTIIIDHGQFGSSADMAPLKQALRIESRVSVYDRAGQGRSDPPDPGSSAPRTAAETVADLHAPPPLSL